MKISVRVKPNAREEKVEPRGDEFTVYVKEPPKENKANKAVIKVLAEYFKTPKSAVSIVRGLKSRQKVIEINRDY